MKKFPILLAQVDIGKNFGFGTISSFGQLTSSFVPAIFSIATLMVTLYFLWGAFDYLISKGNKEEVAAAQQKMTHAIIGFIILILIFFVLPFIVSKLFNGVNLGIIQGL